MNEYRNAEALRHNLLDWYEQNHRILPWRSDPQPYHVMLSEFMLQQTRVETVIPYYRKFLSRWPAISDLAKASEEEVLEAWAGLGYYSRARNLHKAAKAADAMGGLPADVEGLRSLPGVGPYTAGAIASIAFSLPVAAVDGNVERVITRVMAYDDNPRRVAGKRKIEASVLAITHAANAGSVTQGLMELGATVCKPKNPNCAACPWGDLCESRSGEAWRTRPNLPKKKPPTPWPGVSVLCKSAGLTLLGKRGPGLYQGMWEPPVAPLEEGAVAAELAARLAEQSAGYCLGSLREMGVVEHTLTHKKMKLRVFEGVIVEANLPKSVGDYVEFALVDINSTRLPLSKLARKILACGQRSQMPLLAADHQ